MPLSTVGGTNVPGLPAGNNISETVFRNLSVFVKLMEARAENERRDAERKQKMEEREDKINRERAAAKDAEFNSVAEQVFGVNTTKGEEGAKNKGDLSPYTEDARRAYTDKQGSRIVPLKPNDTEDGSVIVAPGYQRENTSDALKSGLLKLRPALKHQLLAEDMKPEDASNLVESGSVRTPADVQKAPQRLATLRKTNAETADTELKTEQSRSAFGITQRKAEAETLSAESKARVDQLIEYERVKGAQLDLEEKTYKVQTARVQALYAQTKAENERKIQELDIAAKQFENSMQPEKAKQLRAQIKKLQLDNNETSRRLIKLDRIDALTQAYQNEPDPSKKEQLEVDILIADDPAKGLGELARRNRENRTAAASAVMDKAKLGMTLLEATKDGNLTPEKSEFIKGAVQAYNHNSALVAKLSGKPPEAEVDAVSVGRIGNTVVTRNIQVPSGVLDNIQMLVPYGTSNIKSPKGTYKTDEKGNQIDMHEVEVEMKTRALINHVTVVHGYLPPGSTNDYVKILNGEPYSKAAPEVLQRALQRLQEADNKIKGIEPKKEGDKKDEGFFNRAPQALSRIKSYNPEDENALVSP